MFPLPAPSAYIYPGTEYICVLLYVHTKLLGQEETAWGRSKGRYGTTARSGIGSTRTLIGCSVNF